MITNLVVRPDGIIHCSNSKKAAELSYPDSGNDTYFSVEEGSFWFNHRNSVIKTVLSRFLPETSQTPTLLDVGGGNGFVAKGLQDAGYEVVLVEPGARGALNAKRRGVRSVINSVFSDLNFRKPLRMSVGLFDVLEHIQDDTGFLTDIHSSLEMSQHLILTVPSYQLLWSEEDVHAGHFRRYTKGQLARLLRQAGFQPLYSSYFFSFLPLPLFVLKALPSRLGLSRSSGSDASVQNEHKQNGFIIKLFCKIELLSLRFFSLPFGSSIVMIAKKMDRTPNS